MHKCVTLQLLWEEFQEAHPLSYRYPRFYARFRVWLGTQGQVTGVDHNTGEKPIVDYAG